MDAKVIYISPCTHKLREEGLSELINITKNPNYKLTKNPDEADIILIAEPQSVYHQQRHILDKYLYKCFAIDFSDRPYFIVPGLYASSVASFWQKYFYKGCPYLFDLYGIKGGITNSFVDNIGNRINFKKDYLFSFIGGSTSWVRKRLFRINFQGRADILVFNTTSDYNNWNVNQTNRQQMQKKYVDVIQRSKFVLCPRGVGKGSIRLFEVMKLGVAPIIISDNWLLPEGPDWNSFALFVKESDISNLLELVESHAHEYQVRGHLARKAWDEYFSNAVIFEYCISKIEDLRQERLILLDWLVLQFFPITFIFRTIGSTSRKWTKHIILSILTFSRSIKK